jgi:hypothetical protein
MIKPEKPQGASGPVAIGPDGAEWKVIAYPTGKAEREELIARLFVRGFTNWVAMQSEPFLAPFGIPKQNDESDLDFTIATALGEKLMELAEFAPLVQHGPTFSNAPPNLSPKEKAALAVQLVSKKSAHQGGANRFLVIYATEQGFWLDPNTIERMRRLLANAPPQFDRVYYVSPQDLNVASVTEIYPGKPHHIFGEWSDDRLDKGRVYLPHPTEMVVCSTTEFFAPLFVNSEPVVARVRYVVTGLQSIKRSSTP